MPGSQACKRLVNQGRACASLVGGHHTAPANRLMGQVSPKRGVTGLASTAKGLVGLSPSSRGMVGLGTSRAMSTVSLGEATEALEHVDQGGVGGDTRLDRNRDGTKRLSFAIVGPQDLGIVNKLLYATYHPDEPLTRHLGLCTGLNSLRDVDRMVEGILVKNLTLIAYDDSGKPVGAAVNNCCLKEEMALSIEESLDGIQDPRYRPIQAIHHQLRRQNRHIYDEIGTDKMFSIRMIGVEVESRGQGVATNLIRRSILLAGCLGFRGIKAEASGRFGRETFAKVGMLPGTSIDYQDFTWQGEQVFAGAKAGDPGITFMKKKFFQSALKHIL